jgi:predicted MFS family arabinose efflux permease
LWLFLATRLVEGVSHLAIVVAAPTLIARLSADRDRGVTLTLWGTFFGVAFALLAWAGIPLVDRAGVPALFATHAAIMAVAALGLMAALPREAVDPEAGTRRGRETCWGCTGGSTAPRG